MSFNPPNHKSWSFTFLVAILWTLNFHSVGQSFGFDMAVSSGVNPAGSSLMLHVNGSLANGLSDHDILFIGAQFSGFYVKDADSKYETSAVLSSELFSGYRHMFPIITHQDQWGDQTHEGLFAEAKVYFNPLVPRQFTIYENGQTNKIKGERSVQLGYGLRLGWYSESKSGSSFFSFWTEVNTNDPFKTLRKMDFPYNDAFPGTTHIALGITIFKW